MPDEEQQSETVIESPLPGLLELPLYHGRRAVGMKTSLTGTGNRIQTEHLIDSKIVLVIEAKVKESGGFEQTEKGLFFVEKYQALDVFEVPGAAGHRLLTSVRQAYRTADDARVGREPLPVGPDGLDLKTDESGVVLTPAEAAELGGLDPAAAVDGTGDAPAVVVFSDGARDLWPDEYATGAPRPKPGEKFWLDPPEGEAANEDLDFVFVKELLDQASGETIAEWTDEQENARLLEAEKAAEAREAEAGVPEASADLSADPDAFASDPPAPATGSYRIDFGAGRVLWIDDLAEVDPAELATAETVTEIDAEGREAVVDVSRALELVVENPEGPAEIAHAGDAPDEEVEISVDEEPSSGIEAAARRLAEETASANAAAPTDEDGFADVELAPILAEHNTFIDRKIEEIRPDLAVIADRDLLAVLIRAEEAGRGRGLKPRGGLLEALRKRSEEIFADLRSIDSPEVPDAGDLEPAEDESLTDDGSE